MARGWGARAVAAVAVWAARIFGIAGFLYPVAEANRPSRNLAERLGGGGSGRRLPRQAGPSATAQADLPDPGTLCLITECDRITSRADLESLL